MILGLKGASGFGVSKPEKRGQKVWCFCFGASAVVVKGSLERAASR